MLGTETEHAPAPVDAGLRPGLAALSAVAGVVHLVMVPSHWGESVVEGLGFAAAGWLQLGLAWLLLRRPSTRVLVATASLNALLVGAWVVSRTAGLPFGAHAGDAESVGFVDLTAVGLELALVAGCLALLLRPHLTIGPRAVGAVGIPVLAVVLGTAALASPSARDHAAHSHGDAAAEHAHANDESAAAHADGDHAAPHAEEVVDDKGLAALSNGHHHAIGPEQPLDRDTRAELSRQIALTQQAAATYPTVADAMAAGYRRSGPYSPGLGAHFTRPNGPALNADGRMDDEDLLSPLGIIYEGTDPEARIAGFMYYSMSAEEPEGFAGPNDVWHYHTTVCIKPAADGGIDAPFGADREVEPGLCERAGGTLMEQTQWMVHVWSVPGWESQQGLFGEVNPALACPDGTYHQRPMEEWIDHPLSTCRGSEAS